MDACYRFAQRVIAVTILLLGFHSAGKTHGVIYRSLASLRKTLWRQRIISRTEKTSDLLKIVSALIDAVAVAA